MRFVLATVALLVLSACLSGPAEPTKTFDVRKAGGARGPLIASASLDGPVPPGCDRTRPAVLHTFDAAPVDEKIPLGIPCLVTSPYGSGEPSIGLTSKGNVFLYPGEQGPAPGVPGQFCCGLGMARSTDNGGNWTRLFSKVAGQVNWQPYTADPFMYVDPATDRVFMEDLAVPPFNCANMSFSDDEGQTWTQTVAGCLVWDHVSYYSGKPVTSRPTGYPTIVYRCAITYVMTTVISEATGCQKTLDGGMTWQPPGQPAFLGGAPDSHPYVPSTCNGAAHHVTVDHRGWVWLPRSWCSGTSAQGQGPAAAEPYVALSKDEGATWTQIHVSNVPSASHDTAVAVDPAGTVYYLWIDNGSHLPVLAVSKDDGKTWTAPRNVAAPGVKRVSNVNLAAGGVGKIGITYGANIEADNGVGVHAVVTLGFDADTERPLFETGFANPPERGIMNGTCGGTCPGQADFITMRIGPDGSPWMSLMNRGLVGAAHLYGGPSLWDEADPNGPYKG